MDSLELASTLSALSTAVGLGRGAPAEAEPLLREALRLRREAKGDDHPLVAQNLNDLAVLRLQQQDYEGALDLYQQSLAIGRKALGEDHPETAATLENLGGVYFRTGRFDESLAAVAQVLDIRRRKLGPESLAVARTLHNRAVVETGAGRRESAAATFAEALPRMRALLGADHPEVAQALCQLGQAQEGREGLRRCRTAVPRGPRAANREARRREHRGGVEPGATGRGARPRSALPGGGGAPPRGDQPGRQADERLDKEAKAELVKLYEAWGRPAEAAKYKAVPAASK